MTTQADIKKMTKQLAELKKKLKQERVAVLEKWLTGWFGRPLKKGDVIVQTSNSYVSENGPFMVIGIDDAYPPVVSVKWPTNTTLKDGRIKFYGTNDWRAAVNAGTSNIGTLSKTEIKARKMRLATKAEHYADAYEFEVTSFSRGGKHAKVGSYATYAAAKKAAKAVERDSNVLWTDCARVLKKS